MDPANSARAAARRIQLHRYPPGPATPPTRDPVRAATRTTWRRHLGEGYQLTEAGTALAPVVQELARWAVVTDSATLTEDDLDTAALTWDMQRRIEPSALPERTVVLAIEFTDRRAAESRYWLHMSPTSVNLCQQDTGRPVDLWLSTPTWPVTRWWVGELSWGQFLRQPEVRVHGDRDLQRQMHHWFKRYLFTPDALSVVAG